MKRGYFGIGVYRPKNGVNIGTLMRSAHCFGAKFTFTVGRRYKQQASDTCKSMRHIPCHHFETIEDLKKHLPLNCRLIGVELDEGAKEIGNFSHPQQCAYMLGAEDSGIPKSVLEKCHEIVQIPVDENCLNVATAGSIVMFDRRAR